MAEFALTLPESSVAFLPSLRVFCANSFVLARALSRTNDRGVAAKAGALPLGQPKKMRPDQQQLTWEPIRDRSLTAPQPTQRRFTVSLRQGGLMPVFCSSQPHRQCFTV